MWGSSNDIESSQETPFCVACRYSWLPLADYITEVTGSRLLHTLDKSLFEYVNMHSTPVYTVKFLADGAPVMKTKDVLEKTLEKCFL